MKPARITLAVLGGIGILLSTAYALDSASGDKYWPIPSTTPFAPNPAPDDFTPDGDAGEGVLLALGDRAVSALESLADVLAEPPQLPAPEPKTEPEPPKEEPKAEAKPAEQPTEVQYQTVWVTEYVREQRCMGDYCVWVNVPRRVMKRVPIEPTTTASKCPCSCPECTCNNPPHEASEAAGSAPAAAVTTAPAAVYQPVYQQGYQRSVYQPVYRQRVFTRRCGPIRRLFGLCR